MTASGFESLGAGFRVTGRWVQRGLGPYWLAGIALATVPLTFLLGLDAISRRSAWIEVVKGLAPVFALFLGAYACRQIRGSRRAGPLDLSMASQRHEPVDAPEWAGFDAL